MDLTNPTLLTFLAKVLEPKTELTSSQILTPEICYGADFVEY